MSRNDTHQWSGWKAHLYALAHRNPASNRAVVEWAQLEPDMRALDMGCGTGAAVNAAARILTSGQAVGVDPSPDFIRIARHRPRKAGNASFHVGTAEDLPFDNEAFDIVWSVHSTHHWKHLEAGISEAHRVLCDGGRFLAVEHHDPGRPWGISADQASTLAEALDAVGFDDVSVEERRAGQAREFLIGGAKT